MKKTVKVAICYDFDGTLAPGNMQEYDFMSKLNMKPAEFWDKSDALAAEQKADSNLAYMLTMLNEARSRNIGFTKEDFTSYGKNIKLFKGVEDWFDRINAYGKELGIEVEHYLLSSGLSEIVEGMPIYKKFNKVYACRFMYDSNGVAIWPAQVVNYTTKTQYLFRISKGCLEENDKSVNDRTLPEERNIPFTNILYVGDGITDVPCMAMLMKFGGHAAAVYTPRKKNGAKTANALLADGRVDCIAPADYTEGSRMDKYVKALLHKVKADSDLQNV
ncbi:MAG: haloacid dehalogenase-like hydrolase [Alphaproteobacteria bacterium]|nr:haloacid dehalogenase-like hydrolase [Alphaproteobacteria bacterium]